MFQRPCRVRLWSPANLGRQARQGAIAQGHPIENIEAFGRSEPRLAPAPRGHHQSPLAVRRGPRREGRPCTAGPILGPDGRQAARARGWRSRRTSPGGGPQSWPSVRGEDTLPVHGLTCRRDAVEAATRAAFRRGSRWVFPFTLKVSGPLHAIEGFVQRAIAREPTSPFTVFDLPCQ